MGLFIDRDPDKMISYGKQAKEVIGSMILLMKTVEGTLDSCAPDLDSNTQREIEKLHGFVGAFMRDIAVYNDVAREIERKGYVLKDIRDRRIV